jgi:outer membrane protein, multidrug efflux system
MKSFINKYLPYIFSFTMLSACSVAKNVAVPTADLPQSYRNGISSTGDTNTIADIPWNTFFSDTSLQMLIDSAIRKNFDLQIALKNMEASSLLYRQVKWNYVPDLRLQLGAGSNRPSDNSLNGISATQFLNTTHIEDFTAAVGLSWEADIWGKIHQQKKSALAAYLQTAEARKAIQTNIVSSVARGFYNLIMVETQLAVAKRNLALNDSTYRMINFQFEAGQVTSLAVEQAQAQKLVAAQLIPQLEQNLALQENALSLLAGSLPEHIITNTKLETIIVSDQLSTGVPSAMLSRRPDVKISELALTMANSKVGITKANMYPALSITASGGINSFKSTNWFNIPASLFGQVAGNLLQPLLNKKQLRTQYEVAKVEREKTVLQFRQTVLFAVGEVSDALVKLEKLSAQHEIAACRTNILKQATANAGLLFESGMATYLEVITAQSNVLQSELDIAAIRRDQLIATVDLYRSLGGGWK